MEYLKRNFSTFNLHLIKTKRFKTVSIEVIFNHAIDKNNITITNFLSSILTFTTAKYNTKLKFSQKMENLYAARIYANNYRVGGCYVTDFEMQVLNDKYAEKGLLNDSLSFLSEIIFNPNVRDNMFDENSFNIIKSDEKSQIERIKEDSKRYSLIKLFEHFDKTSPISFNSKGYIEDLDKIKRDNLYDFYKKFINCSDIDIYIIGDIDFDYTSKLVEKYFIFPCKKKKNDNLFLPFKKHREKLQEFVESDNTNQSKLSIACTIEGMTKYEKDYVLNLYNLILGGTADSKFFKNIREKFSLCYYVSSRAFKQDNILVITSGITKNNYSKIMTLIDKEMKDVCEGNFSDNDILKAKNYYLASVEEIEDSPLQLIASYYAIDKLDSDDIEVRKQKIMEVSREDIVKLANKVYIDTVYLLGGDKK